MTALDNSHVRKTMSSAVKNNILTKGRIQGGMIGIILGLTIGVLLPLAT